MFHHLVFTVLLAGFLLPPYLIPGMIDDNDNAPFRALHVVAFVCVCARAPLTNCTNSNDNSLSVYYYWIYCIDPIAYSLQYILITQFSNDKRYVVIELLLQVIMYSS